MELTFAESSGATSHWIGKTECQWILTARETVRAVPFRRTGRLSFPIPPAGPLSWPISSGLSPEGIKRGKQKGFCASPLVNQKPATLGHSHWRIWKR